MDGRRLAAAVLCGGAEQNPAYRPAHPPCPSNQAICPYIVYRLRSDYAGAAYGPRCERTGTDSGVDEDGSVDSVSGVGRHTHGVSEAVGPVGMRQLFWNNF